MFTGWLTNNFRFVYNSNAEYNVYSPIFMQAREYAARKGTREKARKKKIKKVIEKVGFSVVKKGAKSEKVTNAISPLATLDDSWKTKPIDNVWIVKYHRNPMYSFKEAIEFHRETLHPTMLNKPDAPVNAFIELDLKREKKNKFLDKVSRVMDTPHVFKYGESTKILAFCNSLKEQEKARTAGVDYVGGNELIKQIQQGKFQFKEFDYIIAHADILTDLLLIRGLLKRKFPNLKAGTLGNDMSKLTVKFKNGIRYTVTPHEVFKEYGTIDTTFGLLDMDFKQLEENFLALIHNIETIKPRPTESFIQRVYVKSMYTSERFKINFEEYLPANDKEETNEVEADDTAIISTH
ncbi:50S ribosomal protein L1 [Anthophora retusa]